MDPRKFRVARRPVYLGLALSRPDVQRGGLVGCWKRKYWHSRGTRHQRRFEQLEWLLGGPAYLRGRHVQVAVVSD